MVVSSTCPIDQEDTKALGPAQSWAGVPGALEGGVWPSVSGGAWRLAEPLDVGLLLAAESALFWVESKQLQSWSAWAEKFSIAWNDFCAAVKRSATPSTAGQNRPVGQTGESRKGILWWCYLWWQGICPKSYCTVLY